MKREIQMAPQGHTSSDDATNNLTAVAIDRDKNSASAVKWAVEHLLLSNFIILIHVRVKNPQTRRYPLSLAHDHCHFYDIIIIMSLEMTS